MSQTQVETREVEMTETGECRREGSCWTRRTRFQQVCISGGILTLVSFAVVLAIGLGMNYYARDTFVSNARAGLRGQIDTNALSTMNETGNNYLATMDQGIYGLVRPLYHATLDAYQRTYSLQYVNSYSDNNTDTLAQPVVLDQRSRLLVSLESPSVSFATQALDGSNVATLFASFSDELNKTSHLGVLMKQLYQTHPRFVSLYLGTNTGIFSQYPGIAANRTGPYDPRVRPWYTLAWNNPGRVMMSDIYEDAFGRGIMVTFSYRVANHGVVGVDMLATTLVQLTREIQFYDSGVIHILTPNGVVISSPVMTDVIPMTYSMITNPTINTQLWTSIAETESYSNYVSGYYVVSNRITASNGQKYIMLVTVPVNEIDRPINSVTGQINAGITNMNVITGVVVAICLVCTLVIFVVVTSCTVGPMRALAYKSSVIVNNIGGRLMRNVTTTEKLGIGDASEMFETFLDVVREYNKPKTDTVDNPYYGVATAPPLDMRPIWDEK